MVGLELYAGVKAQWPSLNIIPVHGGKASLEIIEETIVAYPPAQIDLESDESEATLKAGRNKLVIDFESGRAGKIKSLYLGHLEMQQIPMGKTVYPATLELNEKSIDLPASALNRDGEIDMSCVAVHR